MKNEKCFDISQLTASINQANEDYEAECEKKKLEFERKTQEAITGIAFLDEICVELMKLDSALTPIEVWKSYREKSGYDSRILFIFRRGENSYHIECLDAHVCDNTQVYNILCMKNLTVQELYDSLCHTLKN